ncbi:MAG: hypothetical protein AAGA99_00465 [Actinomycetota bacterium]
MTDQDPFIDHEFHCDDDPADTLTVEGPTISGARHIHLNSGTVFNPRGGGYQLSVVLSSEDVARLKEIL